MSLTTLRLPAVFRAASELADAVTRHRPEDHALLAAAQQNPHGTHPSHEEQFAWHESLERITSAANRLKRALGATGVLAPSRRRDDASPPAWHNLFSEFADLDYSRSVRAGLLRLAHAALDLSGYGAVKLPPEDLRTRGMGQLRCGLEQVWPALTVDERSEVRDELPVLRRCFGWPGGSTDDPPGWTGPAEIDPEDTRRVFDTTEGFYTRSCEFLDRLGRMHASIPNPARTLGGGVQPSDSTPAPSETVTPPADNPLARSIARREAEEKRSAEGTAIGAERERIWQTRLAAPVEEFAPRWACGWEAFADELRAGRLTTAAEAFIRLDGLLSELHRVWQNWRDAFDRWFRDRAEPWNRRRPDGGGFDHPCLPLYSAWHQLRACREWVS